MQEIPDIEAYVGVIRALVPELVHLSVHDATAQPIWMSADYLRPEDQALVSEALREGAPAQDELVCVAREDGRILAPLLLAGPQREHRGVLLLELSTAPAGSHAGARLLERLAAVRACLGAELARGAAPAPSPAADAALVQQIVDALREERFELLLQPILPLHAELDLLRFEVLLRMRTREGALLPPAAFLPLAARNGLMPGIDRWVVRTLLAWLMNHRKRWFRIPSVFAVNLGGESLDDPGFLEFVESCMAKSGVPPQALCFEISVRSTPGRADNVARAVRRIEELGCTVAMDDVGSGDLAYGNLREFTAQFIKIDRALVGSAHQDRVAGAVIGGLVRAAQMLGAMTIAESIESADELAAVRSLGVDFAQGFLLGRPAALASVDFSAARHAAQQHLGDPRH